ncbi:MAG: HlyD family efflux transporter periplasmic adaptor subunit [Planctomycetaceae bacterium]|nr:HlyD family efflux transporter periplasmic adaptor subunit [Planctomycetales bacterium]MCB9921589.1 HlyD family efflux transporter periplasmic adaptor subunit [Planctomycetaceae bacterium]
MSTAGPLDSQFQPSHTPIAGVGPSPHPSVGGGDMGNIDPVLIQQTKNEIRTLVTEITQLCQADIPLAEFYEEYLRRVVSALASHGGAVWSLRDDGSLQLDYQVNLPKAEVVDDEASRHRHGRLLQNVIASGQPTLVPPQSGSTDGGEAGNSTDFLLILACLRVDQETIGVVEIFQRAGGGPTTQRGYLRFLVQMCEHASDFLKNRRLRHLGDRQSLWEQLEGFIRVAHQGLDSKATAYTIVNESRRLIQCDRVSIALRKGRKFVVEAVSGLDTIDRRATEVQQLGQLATIVAAAKRPLWYTGSNRDLPPQIEDPLHAYVDQAHAKMLAIVPLYPPTTEAELEKSRQTQDAIGALIVEELASSRIDSGMSERIEIVAEHSASALANAIEHESLFLLPVWRAIGNAKWIVQARTLPKTIAVAAAVIAAVLSLVLIPKDFDLAAKGKLQPAVRRDIFAHLDGIVIDVPVRHEQMVRTGDVLARMSNNKLEVEIANLIGRKRTTQERIRSLTRAQYDQRLTVEDQNQMAGELLELAQAEESIDRELALLREQQERLVLRSEMDGQVVTWSVGDVLLRRPVQRGQVLMSIVDPKDDWELELNMQERRMGHLTQAVEDSGELPTVTFALASHPGKDFVGQVTEIHRVAEVRGEDGNTVLLRVAVDKEMLPELRSETTVTARVHCGRRSIGFVVFHELIETIQTKILFWL